jgi:hypothetical protein
VGSHAPSTISSAKEITSYRFPNGDKSQVRGVDGWLEASDSSMFVPKGRSVWEFGVSGAEPSKAASDFVKRTSKFTKEEQGEMTFVFASPDTWDAPRRLIQDWEAERKAESNWKAVVYLDGSRIEDWLKASPSVAAHYATEMGYRPVDGARSVGEFWDEFASRYKTKLSEDVVLAGREGKATELLERLLETAGPVELAADSPDEVLAFAIAAIRKAEPATREFLENRTLILDDERAARFFANSKNLIFLPRSQAVGLSGQLANIGPTLLAKGRDQTTRKSIFLDRPSTHAFAESLETMGLDASQAYTLAGRCARSLTVLARLYSCGTSEPPSWVAKGREFLPAVLAGSWDATNSKDEEALRQLISIGDYPSLEGSLRSLAKLRDPPVDIQGAYWTIRAPVDTFVHLAHLFTADDVRRLRTVTIDVFSEIDTSEDPDAPFSIEATQSKRYSNWLREGLANTLLQIAVLAEESGFDVAGIKPQRWVEQLVADLPGLSSGTAIISAMRRELWTLMEAAPRPLLNALEQLLKGDAGQAKTFFSKEAGLFTPTSPHTYVLWALETLAWDPVFLPRVSMILARLAAIDPGGQFTNRPINSLRSIFLPWAPNTHASIAQRKAALTDLVGALPETGWKLAVLLLPKSHDTNDITRKPKFRDAGASQCEVLTNGKVWEGQELAIDIVLQLTADDPGRWSEVVKQFYNWTPSQKARAITELSNWFSTTAMPTKDVWEELNELVNRHVAFAHADWALAQDEIAHCRELLQKFAPADAVERISWLFDRWSPQMGVQYEANDEEIEKARRSALEEILRSPNPSDLFRLIEIADEPGSVAVAAGSSLETADEFLPLITRAITEGDAKRVLFARVLSAVANNRYPSTWKQLFRAASSEWQPIQIGILLANWDDNGENWDFVESFGEETRATYWKEKAPFSMRLSGAEVSRGVEEYLSVGRAEAAIRACHYSVKELPTELIVRLMRSLVVELTSKQRSPDQMTDYYAEHVLGELDTRTDLSEMELAGIEYASLPLLERKPRRLVIHRLMASSPEFYINLIQSVFGEASDERHSGPSEITAAQKAKARNDYQLLHDFDVVPGTTGTEIDYNILHEWVSRVRDIAAESDRTVITDIYIGHVLAHAPQDEEGVWPPKAVRSLLENLQNADIERGISTERYNMRGVYSKALDEGGDKERAIANTYRSWSSACADYPATAALLERIAEGYERHAEEDDDRAAVRKLQQ